MCIVNVAIIHTSDVACFKLARQNRCCLSVFKRQEDVALPYSHGGYLSLLFEPIYTRMLVLKRECVNLTRHVYWCRPALFARCVWIARRKLNFTPGSRVIRRYIGLQSSPLPLSVSRRQMFTPPDKPAGGSRWSGTHQASVGTILPTLALFPKKQSYTGANLQQPPFRTEQLRKKWRRLIPNISTSTTTDFDPN